MAKRGCLLSVSRDVLRSALRVILGPERTLFTLLVFWVHGVLLTRKDNSTPNGLLFGPPPKNLVAFLTSDSLRLMQYIQSDKGILW